MISGEMSPEDFSDKLNSELGPLIRRSQAEAKAQATEFGPLESFELLNAQRTEHGTDLQYRATFEYVMRQRYLSRSMNPERSRTGASVQPTEPAVKSNLSPFSGNPKRCPRMTSRENVAFPWKKLRKL
jgi:hypothetical protein